MATMPLGGRSPPTVLAPGFDLVPFLYDPVIHLSENHVFRISVCSSGSGWVGSQVSELRNAIYSQDRCGPSFISPGT